MRHCRGLLLLLATAAIGQLADNHYTASEIRQEGDITHLHGNVVMKELMAVIYAEDADFNSRQYHTTVRGDSRIELLSVTSQPDFNPDYMTNPRPATDPARFTASTIRHAGAIMELRGNVEIRLPGLWIHAESADFNKDNAEVNLHGDSTFNFHKANIQPFPR